MFRMIRLGALALLASGVLTPAARGGPQDASGRFEEVRRFKAAEARQGVAVDPGFVYAITNRAIGKYEKRTGTLVKRWEGPPDGPIIHLDSGVVIDGRLYCAHSNYDALPMESSIEIFDTATLEHVGSQSLGIMDGSATWVDRKDGFWWVAFANYAGDGGVPGRGPEWTVLLKFDEQWRRVAGYTYPREIVAKFGEMSNSGGTWGADGFLYITGHDNAEIYKMALPTAGTVLKVVATFPVRAEGQGIAWDRSDPGMMYTILRSSTEVVASRLR